MSTSLSLDDGIILERGSEEYESARKSNFSASAHCRPTAFPQLIAQVKTVTEIQSCVKYAIENEMTVCVRSGGHNWYGSSLHDDCVMVDMKHFDSIEFDLEANTATVGPAAKGSKLNEMAAEHNLCFPSGHCDGVPLGGFLLGGGYGWCCTHFGKSAELIKSLTVVTGTGDIIEVMEEEGEGANTVSDWMWMARGSASAFPGIVVSFTVHLPPLPKIIRSRTSFYKTSQYEEIYNFLSHNQNLPTKSDTALILAYTPPPLAEMIKEPRVCMMSLSVIADSEEEFQSIISSFDVMPVDPYFPPKIDDFNTFSQLSKSVGEGFPPNFHYLVRCYEHYGSGGSSEKKQFDAALIQETYDSKCVPGFSSSVYVPYPGNKDTPRTKQGAYGKTMPDSMLFICGIFDPNSKETVEQHQPFIRSMEEVCESSNPRYNPLEYPLNKDTFENSFEDPNKVLLLRKKLDPTGVFFDPSTMKPTHL